MVSSFARRAFARARARVCVCVCVFVFTRACVCSHGRLAASVRKGMGARRSSTSALSRRNASSIDLSTTFFDSITLSVPELDVGPDHVESGGGFLMGR